MADAAAEAPAEEADFGEQKPADSDSDSDSDGLPPLDGYWSSMLNVTKTAEPVKPQLLLKPKLDDDRRGKGGKGKGGKRGKGKPSDFGPLGMWDPLGPMGFRKGGKGKGMRSNSGNPNNIGDFLAWAQDENASDGSRPCRERSRSPARQPASMRLESFLEWAKDTRDAKEEPRELREPGGGLSSFMAWAAEGGNAEGEQEQDEREGAREAEQSEAVQVKEAVGEVKEQDPPDWPKAEPETQDEPADTKPAAPSELIVPKELQATLQAMGGGEGAGAPRRTKSEDGSESDEDN